MSRKRGPHVAPRFGLTERQRATLGDHVGDVEVTDRIASAFRLAAQGMIYGEWLREVGPPQIKRLRRHHMRTAKLARELVAALDFEAPHGPMSELTSRAGYELSWETLRRGLERLEEVAEAEAATQTSRRRGRPSLAWRDELIRSVLDAYPQGEAMLGRGSHFERTVEMLLSWLGDKPADVHDVVVRAVGGKSRLAIATNYST